MIYLHIFNNHLQRENRKAKCSLVLGFHTQRTKKTTNLLAAFCCVMRDAGNNGNLCQLLLKLTGNGHGFIMLFLRLARFFQQFLKYVCPAFSAPGFRLGVQRMGAFYSKGLMGSTLDM